MATTNRAEGSARERLLAAADELFYEQGVHTVGIDRVIERAGVAKASLYSAFGSKDELVRAYLEARALRQQARIRERLERHEGAGERILAVFDLIEERAEDPKYRGCAFINANAEGPRDAASARTPADGMRAWILELFTNLSSDLGARDPRELGRQLKVLYDGALVGASMDRDPGVARTARVMASALVEQARGRAARASASPSPARARGRRG